MKLMNALLILLYSVSNWAQGGPEPSLVFTTKVGIRVFMNQRICDPATNACFRSQLQFGACSLLRQPRVLDVLQCSGSMQYVDRQGKILSLGLDRLRGQILPTGQFHLEKNLIYRLSIKGRLNKSLLSFEEVIFQESVRSTPISNIEVKLVEIIPFLDRFQLESEIRWCGDQPAQNQAMSGQQTEAINRCLLNYREKGASLGHLACNGGKIIGDWRCF